MKLFPFLNKKNIDLNYSDDSSEKKTIYLDVSIKNNLDYIKSEFHYPDNRDLCLRSVYIKSLDTLGCIISLSTMVHKANIETNILKPLMNKEIELSSVDILSEVIDKVINVSSVEKINELNKIVFDIVNGKSILFVDGFDNALSIDTIRYEHRSVEKPQSETVIKGPHESFTESESTNRSLIRKQLKSKNLITEYITIGVTDNTNITLMYLKNIVNPDLLDEIRKRINNIKTKTDGIEDSSILEQYLEERPYSPIPTLLYTERPDIVSSFIKEGHVAILTENSPSALIAPVTFWSFFHTASDQYQRWLYGNFIRILRFIAYSIALFTPSLYIAATNYHPGSIPFDLLLSVAATREIVPFPAYIEVLIMEISFELVREAGLRVPTPIGPTIGIVGALILGQAAVEANIVSPILIIVVSITGLSSFAIPDNNISYAVRIGRFMFLFSSIMAGIMGISILFSILIIYLTSIESFGVSFFSPISPHFPSSKDTFFRPILLKRILRPYYLNQIDKQRGAKPKGR